MDNLYIEKNQNQIFVCSRLIPFRVSRVSGVHLCGFAPGRLLQSWSSGDVPKVWEIWSAQNLNSIPFIYYMQKTKKLCIAQATKTSIIFPYSASHVRILANLLITNANKLQLF